MGARGSKPNVTTCKRTHANTDTHTQTQTHRQIDTHTHTQRHTHTHTLTHSLPHPTSLPLPAGPRGDERREAEAEERAFEDFLGRISARYSRATLDSLYNFNLNPEIDLDLVQRMLDHIDTQPPGAVLCFLPGWAEISELHKRCDGSLLASFCVWLLVFLCGGVGYVRMHACKH